MTIVWDEVGERHYEAGVDRGVLYPADGLGVPWNGLLSVEESADDTSAKTYYMDGQKFLDQTPPGDFAATLQAFTYPDEFEEYVGLREVWDGVSLANQPMTKTFGLSYRTQLGNDTNGLSFGYKLHLLFNLIATPSNKAYASNAESISPMTFSWDLRSIPELTEIPRFYRPTAHLVLESTKLDAEVLAQIESRLYTTRRLFSLSEFLDHYGFNPVNPA